MADEKVEAPPPFDMNKFLASMIAQNGGDKDATIRQLGRENLRVRNKFQAARRQIEELTAKVPGDGAVVLKGDEAKDHLTLQERKLTAKVILETVDERDKLKADLAGLSREKDVTRAASTYEDVKYKPTILLDQLNNRSMDLTFRKVKVKDENGNEEEVELPHVRKNGDDKGQWTELKPYIEKDLKEYKPALEVTDAAPESTQERRFTPTPGGAPSAPGKARGNRDLVMDHIASRYSVPGEPAPDTSKK